MDDRFLIVSDVDGTLLGDDRALAKLADWLSAQGERWRLVLNSGRLTSSLRRSVEQTLLPAPAALIGGVGTQIELFDSREMLADWPQFEGGWDSAVIREVMLAQSGVELQPEHFNATHKISFFAYDVPPETLEYWRRLLQQAGQSVQLVYSSARDLDVLPEGVDKGTAAAYLAEKWDYSPDQVVVCGDTGNDLAMFRQGFRGIVVGNALPELRSLKSQRVYLAEAACAGGVLEGLQRLLA